jgi:Ca2+-binding RTX toxin-like protein
MWLRRSHALAVAAVALVGVVAPTPAQAKPGDVYVGLNDGGTIGLHPNGSATGHQFVVGTGPPYDSNGGGDFGTDGTLYVSDYGNPAILKVDVAQASATILHEDSPYQSLSDVEFSPDGSLYASDFSAPAVYRVNPKTGHSTVLAHDGQLTSTTYALGSAPNGDLYAGTDDSKLVRIDPQTGHQKLISDDPDLASPIGIAVPLDGKTVYVLNESSVNTLLRVHPKAPTSSNATPITTGTSLFAGSPYDLAWGFNGKLLASDDASPGHVIQIDPASGEEKTMFSGNLLVSTEGLTVEPPKCHGMTATLYGTNKPDVIKASPYDDVIAGLGGADTIKGLDGDDVICGNGGNDKLVGGPGKDKLVGGPGHDTTHQ